MGGMDPEASSQLAGFGSFAPINFDNYNLMEEGEVDEEYISDDEF
jgi:hypothetical protein